MDGHARDREGKSGSVDNPMEADRVVHIGRIARADEVVDSRPISHKPRHFSRAGVVDPRGPAAPHQRELTRGTQSPPERRTSAARTTGRHRLGTVDLTPTES